MKKVETQDFASHKEKSIYSSAYNCLLDCNGVDGRRKILRLYWAGAVIFTTATRATGITAAKILCHVVFGSIFIFFRFDYDWHCNIRDLFLQ